MSPSHATFRTRLPVASLAGVLLFGISLVAGGGCGSFAAQGINAEGVRLFDQCRYDESIRQFQQAVFHDPNNADAYYNLAAAFHRKGAIEGQPADLAQAERYYNQCLDHSPNHRECYRGLAVLLMQQSRTAEAFRLLEGWVQRNPGSPDPKVELARLCEETGDREAAKSHLVDALKVDERNARALAALGRIRELSGETREAILAYQRSLSYDRFQTGLSNRLAALQAAPGWQSQAPGQPTTLPSIVAPPSVATAPVLAAQPSPAGQPAATSPQAVVASQPTAPPQATAAVPPATGSAAAASSSGATQSASSNATTVR